MEKLGGSLLRRVQLARRQCSSQFPHNYLGCDAVYHMCQIWAHYGETNTAGNDSSYLHMIAHATTRVCGLGYAIIAAVIAEDVAYLYNQILVVNRRFQGKPNSRTIYHLATYCC